MLLITDIVVNKMKLRREQVKLRSLLKETITLLCKNGLDFSNGIIIDALIGITTDGNETFLVKLEEKVGDVDSEAKADDMTNDKGHDSVDQDQRMGASQKRRTIDNFGSTPAKRHRTDSDDDDSADDFLGNGSDDSDVENAVNDKGNADLTAVKQEKPDYDDQPRAQITASDIIMDGGSHDGSSSTWNQSSTNDTNAAGSQQVGLCDVCNELVIILIILYLLGFWKKNCFSTWHR